MLHRLIGYCRRHPVPLIVLATTLGPTWYGLCVIVAERDAPRFPILASVVRVNLLVIDTEWFQRLTPITLALGLTYVFFLWWTCRSR